MDQLIGKYHRVSLLLLLVICLTTSTDGFAIQNRAAPPLPKASLTAISAIRGGDLSPEIVALAETVAPRIGIITSTALYFAPALTVWKAIQENDMGELNPLPLAIMSIVSVSFLAYGLVSRDKYVALSNIAGSIGSIGYVVGILPLMSDRKKALRQTQAVLMAGVAAVLSMWSYLGVAKASPATICAALGTFASTLGIIMAASPLSTIRTVLQKKNSASIIGALTAAQVINTSLWSAYGLVVKDVFVWAPNVVALGLGFVQLALKIVFPA